jgi:WD40 repeat protein
MINLEGPTCQLMRFVPFAMVSFFCCLSAFSQDKGLPLITNISARVNGGHYQNWSILQDDRGVIYVGNGFGVQEYDGLNWRMITLPNGSYGRKLMKDSSGTIFVASAAELGYLEADRLGRMGYRSLLEYIPEQDRSFTTVRDISITPEGIYFCSSERLFRFTKPAVSGEDWKVKIWRPVQDNEGFDFCALVGDSLYIQLTKQGLAVMLNDSLVVVTPPEHGPGAPLRFMMKAPALNGSVVASALSLGLLIYDGKTFERFRTDPDTLGQSWISACEFLPSGEMFLATFNDGLLMVDKFGKILHQINSGNGLMSETTSAAFTDTFGNVWITQIGGIAQIEYATGISVYPLPSVGITY